MINGRIRNLERELEKMKVKEKIGKERKKQIIKETASGEGKKRDRREERIRMEKLWKAEEKEKRKKSIIVEELKETKEEVKNKLREIWKEMMIVVRIEEVRNLLMGRREWGRAWRW